MMPSGLLHVADEFGAVRAQSGKHIANVVHVNMRDATYAQRIHRCVLRVGADCLQIVEPRQLEPAIAVPGPRHCDVLSHLVEPHPRVRWSKSAQLLAPGGWIAVLYNGEKYEERVESRLLEARIARSTDGGAWARTPRHTVAQAIAASGLFEPALEQIHTDSVSIPAERVLSLEQTRGTVLDYAAKTQQSFADELREIIGDATEVAATLETSVTMARRR